MEGVQSVRRFRPGISAFRQTFTPRVRTRWHLEWLVGDGAVDAKTLDDLESREAVLITSVGAFATAALFAATHPSRTAALVVLEGYADPMAQRTDGLDREETNAALVPTWGTGEVQHVLNPGMPWNEEIRAAWARMERLAASPGTVALVITRGDSPSAAVSLSRPRGEHIGRRLPRDVRPQRAIRCAMAIRDAVQALGIEVRAGLHTGECEVRGDDIGGIGVHMGARVSALAGANDVLVSSTLRDPVIGSGLEFEERGAYELKGVPGEWRLFAVASA
jgi:hypothetical protein